MSVIRGYNKLVKDRKVSIFCKSVLIPYVRVYVRANNPGANIC